MSTSTPTMPDPAAPRASDPTIGRLVADASENLSAIVRNEIALAKAEVSVDVAKGAKGGGMLAVAAVFALFGLIFLLHTIALGIAVWLPLWASYGIVTLVLLILAAILGLVGVKVLKKINPKPERTISSTKTSVEAVKRSTSGDRTRSVRVADPIGHGATQGDARAIAGAPVATASTPGSGSTSATD